MPGQVVILGPGLLGGSLALALAQRGENPIVWGRRQAPLDHLREREAGLRVEPDLDVALSSASFVILATPIGVMPDLLQQIASRRLAPAGATVTDVGSVKGPIVREANTILEGSAYRFVGSHPMAGSEASGVEAARVDLFKGAMCLLTPSTQTDPQALEETREFWTDLECRLHDLPPEEHDHIVARVSHMPHALASLIVSAAIGDDPTWARFSGAGLHDTTRIASGEPGMWAEILAENQKEVLTALRQTKSELSNLIELLEAGENEAIRRFLLEAKELRDTHIVPQR